MTVRKLALALSAVTVLCAAAPVVLQDPQDPKKEEDKTRLELQMKEVNSTLRLLRRTAGNEEKIAESLKHTRRLQVLFTEGRAEKPIMLEEVPEADRAKFLLDYQKMMLKVSRDLLDLEAALIEGDVEKAGEIRKTVNNWKKEGHKQFKG